MTHVQLSEEHPHPTHLRKNHLRKKWDAAKTFAASIDAINDYYQNFSERLDAAAVAADALLKSNLECARERAALYFHDHVVDLSPSLHNLLIPLSPKKQEKIKALLWTELEKTIKDPLWKKFVLENLLKLHEYGEQSEQAFHQYKQEPNDDNKAACENVLTNYQKMCDELSLVTEQYYRDGILACVQEAKRLPDIIQVFVDQLKTLSANKTNAVKAHSPRFQFAHQFNIPNVQQSESPPVFYRG